MGLIGDGVINAIRNLKRQAFSDTFTRLVYTPHSSASGQGKPTYPEGSSHPCRVILKASPDILPSTDVQVTDAEMHFGLEVTLLPDDRVRVTHLHGDKVTALDYTIESGPIRTSVGQQASLVLVKE